MSHHHHHQQPETMPTDQKEIDKLALRASQAGMRLIAQTHIYNGMNWERLAQFISDSYHPDTLEEQPVESRVAVFKTSSERAGRLRIKQVLATNEHHVILVLEAEKMDGLFYQEMKVEEEYPHRITAYMHQPLQAIG